jgi:polysaccharide export outer membrane protein
VASFVLHPSARLALRGPKARVASPAHIRMARNSLLAALSASLLGGCAIVPKAGPLTAAISNEAKEEAAPFMLVPVSRPALTELANSAPEDFRPLATSAPAPDSMIHVGDMISVTLWEYGSGLLGPLSTSTGTATGLVGAQSATVPNQSVDQTGTILVPFAGEIRAAGRSTRQVQAAIIAALKGKASNAQVLVQIVQTTDNAVTVTGDVNRPGRFPLASSGTRLLDALSTAGGTTGKARDMQIQLSRGGEVRTTRLAAIHSDPVQNIFLKPGDVVTLNQEPQSVVVLGATNKNLVVPFDKTRLTLAETLGAGGGLADHLADPYGVYVLRYETPAVAKRLRTEPIPDYLVTGKLVPVVYQIDLRSADGLMLSQNFMMRDRDLVYVADAPSVQIGKLSGMFNSVAAIFKNNTFNPYTNQFR